MHPSFMPLGFAFPGLMELVILVVVSCFLLGTWRVKVIFNHVRWFLSDLRGDDACAIPGGFVFVSDSLIEFSDGDQEELTFVLAHEMAHVLCGHAKNHILANVLLSRLAGLAVRGSISGLFAGGALTRLLSEVFDKGYSQELEHEADAKAVALLRRSGRDVQAAIRLLQRLKEIHGDDPLMSYFSTHPTPEERIANIQRIARKIR